MLPAPKARTRRTAHKPTRKIAAGSKTAAPPARGEAGRPADACADAEAFNDALVATGEAAPLDEEGKLPAGATHKIQKNRDGSVKVVRRRFSVA